MHGDARTCRLPRPVSWLATRYPTRPVRTQRQRGLRLRTRRRLRLIRVVPGATSMSIGTSTSVARPGRPASAGGAEVGTAGAASGTSLRVGRVGDLVELLEVHLDLGSGSGIPGLAMRRRSSAASSCELTRVPCGVAPPPPRRRATTAGVGARRGLLELHRRQLRRGAGTGAGTAGATARSAEEVLLLPVGEGRGGRRGREEPLTGGEERLEPAGRRPVAPRGARRRGRPPGPRGAAAALRRT